MDLLKDMSTQWKKQSKQVFGSMKNGEDKIDFGGQEFMKMKGGSVEEGVKKELVGFVEDKLKEVEGRNLKY